MIRRFGGGLLVLGLLALGAACYSDRSGTAPSAGACTATLAPNQFGSVLIAISGFAFQQTPVHVRAGGKVTWVNCEPDGTPSHTTTSDNSVWGSALLDPGATYTFTFPAAGTFGYHCEPHPSMTAQIIVDP